MYGKLSSLYYVLTKPIGLSLDGDLEFYKAHLEKDKASLEVAVGSGRLLIPFLEEGYKIDGLDLSKEMLSICQLECEKRNLRTNLYLDDIEKFQSDKTYHRIIIPSGSFSLFTDLDAVFRNLYSLLEVRGKLIFDIVYPLDIKVGNTYHNEIRFDGNKMIVLEDHHLDLNSDKQYSLQKLKYFLFEDGQLIKEEAEDFRLYYHDLQFIKGTLEKHGFVFEEAIGNYKEVLQEDGSYDYDLISIVARKDS